jgi:hypothetical protein
MSFRWRNRLPTLAASVAVNRHDRSGSKQRPCQDHYRADRVALWVGWGTASAAAKSATDLTAAAPEARSVATTVQGTINVANDTLVLAGTITATAARAIAEIGAFDALGTGSPPTGGNLDLYSDFAVMNLSSGDSLAYTLRLSFS